MLKICDNEDTLARRYAWRTNTAAETGGGKEERRTGTHTEKEDKADDHPGDKKQTQGAGGAEQAQAQLILTKVPVLGNAKCYLMSCHKATEPRVG